MRIAIMKTLLNMKIGVSGASGHLGRATVAELVQRPGGHEVVAISRTPETITALAQGRFGDYNRPESLAEASAGLDSSAHHPGPRTRKARGAEHRCHRRGHVSGPRCASPSCILHASLRVPPPRSSTSHAHNQADGHLLKVSSVSRKT